MINFKAEIERYERNGEKTGWSYVSIPATLANKIKPACKKSYRVKGKIDEVEIFGVAIVPMGEGNFILPLKSSLRKTLRKELGDEIELSLEEDIAFKIEMPDDLEICLHEESHLMKNFLTQPKSYQNYYINWINQAKTEITRTKRIVATVIAMDKKQNFGAMMRENKAKK